MFRKTKIKLKSFEEGKKFSIKRFEFYFGFYIEKDKLLHLHTPLFTHLFLNNNLQKEEIYLHLFLKDRPVHQQTS